MSTLKSEWSTDKIVGTGLVAALILSIIVSAWTGGGGAELQTTIASGLIGFIGRIAMDKAVVSHEQQPKISQQLGNIAEKATQAQSIVNAVDTITKVATKKMGK